MFKRIGEAGLTAKVGKCQIAMSRCGYLEHVVGSGSVQPEKAKLTAVEEFPVSQHILSSRIFYPGG